VGPRVSQTLTSLSLPEFGHLLDGRRDR
jgi:hypothetical protein